MKRLLQSTIAKRIFGSFIIVIIPIIALSLLANYLSMNIAQKEIERSYESSIKQLSVLFSERLSELESLSNAFRLDDDLIYLNNVSAESANDFFRYMKFIKKINLYMSSRSMDEDISLFLIPKGRVLSSKYGACSINQYDYKSDDIVLSIWAFRSSLRVNNGNCLSMIKAEGNIGKKQYSILVSTEISETQVKNLLSSFKSSNSLTTFIVDSQGNLIADMDVNLDNVVSKNKIFESKNNVDYFTYIFNNIKYRGIYSKLSQYNMTIGMIFDERQMLKPINDVRIWLILVLVSSLLFSVMFISFTYRKIIYPINNLIETMKGVKKGDLKKRVPFDSKSDFGFLMEQFNSMVEQLDRLVNDVYITHLKLKQSQIRFLQSQINPHFLYNSLFCLYNMINSEDIENAANLTLYLGKYFKIASHSDKACISLRQEMDNIQIYFNIHSFRNPAKIVLEVECQDGLNDIMIPRLCIQTFVENSILHGIENSDRKCYIRIKVFKENEFVVIIVEDNGCGISQEKIKEIEDKFTDINYEEDHHGILNVYCRMKLMYGDNASMAVSNINPAGTSIMIKLPLEMIKEGDGKHV